MNLADLATAMDTPAPQPESPPPDPSSLPREQAGNSVSSTSHIALGLFLALTLGLLAFRGYGNVLGSRPVQPGTAALTDLNSADRAELEQVPGVGPALAKRIDDHRQTKGPFKSLEELRQVKGFGPLTLDKVRPFLRVEPSAIPPAEPQNLEPLVLERKPTPPPPARAASSGKIRSGDPPIDVNTADIEGLMRLPSIGPATARNIVTARTERPFNSVADLDRVKGIGPKTIDKLRPFVIVK